jgi:hypothetical protein
LSVIIIIARGVSAGAISNLWGASNKPATSTVQQQ